MKAPPAEKKGLEPGLPPESSRSEVHRCSLRERRTTGAASRQGNSASGPVDVEEVDFIAAEAERFLNRRSAKGAARVLALLDELEGEGGGR